MFCIYSQPGRLPTIMKYLSTSITIKIYQLTSNVSCATLFHPHSLTNSKGAAILWKKLNFYLECNSCTITIIITISRMTIYLPCIQRKRRLR